MSNIESIRLIEGEDEQSPEIEVEQVYNYLIAKGINSCSNSYSGDEKEYVVRFARLPLKDIAPLWGLLNDAVKISILNENLEEFTRLMGSLCNE